MLRRVKINFTTSDADFPLGEFEDTHTMTCAMGMMMEVETKRQIGRVMQMDFGLETFVGKR